MNLIRPTLTLGPSSILKTRMTALLEAMRSYCGLTLANWRPCSARSSFRTTSAFFIFVGSNWLSTLRPTLRSLKRSRMSDSETERSEEHTSELQSRLHLVCRLLLEKKKKPPLREGILEIPKH